MKTKNFLLTYLIISVFHFFLALKGNLPIQVYDNYIWLITCFLFLFCGIGLYLKPKIFYYPSIIPLVLLVLLHTFKAYVTIKTFSNFNESDAYKSGYKIGVYFPILIFSIILFYLIKNKESIKNYIKS
jgi:hypothetical protein